MKISEWPLPYVRVKCAQCDREGRMKLAGLIERFGPDRDLFVVREKLTEPGCKRENKKEPCQSILPDARLVQAIVAKTEDDVLVKELLPEAREWREKLGMGER
ncbi:hypothetical protein BDS110ZK17_25000 [Bradyrhizobium diazoefficiens]|nr:hypothetical protein XF16B_46770 [Bradyrhizobium diazoefficiens]BCF70330.1 hypothetical protein XF19B_46830 [Bradyrhizobium diazoefficiens]